MSNRVPITLRLRAARHEMSCEECRVTWKSWIQRLVGTGAGRAPKVKRAVSDGD